MEGIRSFIAIEVPGDLQTRMGELQQELKKFEPDIRWVRPGNIHLTLKFLGTVSKEILEKVSLAVAPAVYQRTATRSRKVLPAVSRIPEAPARQSS